VLRYGRFYGPGTYNEHHLPEEPRVHAGEQSLFTPNLIDGTTQIGRPRNPDYHFNTDLTDKAVAWLQATRSLTPDRPFLMCFAQSASHPPHTPPVSWLNQDLYKGKFDQGWDAIRKEISARQIKMGIVPEGTKLAANPESVQKWENLTADEHRRLKTGLKQLLCRRARSVVLGRI
jgi:arylsulfatase A-like enzyme